MRFYCWKSRSMSFIWLWINVSVWLNGIIAALSTTTSNIRRNKIASAISIQNDDKNNEYNTILSKSSSLPGNAIVSSTVITTFLDDTNSDANVRVHEDDAIYPKTSIYIPYQFKTDRQYIAQVPQPFPRWNEDKTDPKLIIDSIIEFITYQTEFYSKYLTDPYYSTTNKKLSQYKLPMNYTLDHPKGVINYWRPETLYIITSNGIYCSTTAKNITERWCAGTIKHKLLPTENIMSRAYDQLVSSPISQHRWPLLHAKIIQEKNSLPFLAHYSDWKGCNYHNWNSGKSSFPLYSVAASMDCYNTFPFPNSRTGRFHTLRNVTSWDHTFAKQRNTYKEYNTKIPQIVWRGSLTGVYNDTIRPPRYHLLEFVHSKTLLTAEERSMFDIKLSSIGIYADEHITKHDVDQYLGGVSNAIAMEDFQKYKAVLDIDGHSWSSRFGDLLCYSTVVLKVEPEWVDYFYYPENTALTLLPWKHYIPIQRNLSDLVEKAKYVLDPKNEPHIQQIIHNAQQWCSTRLVNTVVAEDALDIWEYNVKVFNNNDPSWSKKWNQFVSQQSNLIPQQPNSEADVETMSHPQQMSKIEEKIYYREKD